MASQPCALGCGNPVNPHDTGVWKEVTGFVGGPRKDSMRLREDTGRAAHHACVLKVMEGQDVAQPTMFEQPAVLEPQPGPAQRGTAEYHDLWHNITGPDGERIDTPVEGCAWCKS